jgi:hypothetical protein
MTEDPDFRTDKSDTVEGRGTQMPAGTLTFNLDEEVLAEAFPASRRTIDDFDEFVEEISVLPDHLDVNVHGAPPLHVRYQVVGMSEWFRTCRRRDVSEGVSCRRGDLNPHALAGTSPSS